MKNNDHKQNGPDPDMPAKFVETTFRVRYAETDQMGIVHHAAYVHQDPQTVSTGQCYL